MSKPNDIVSIILQERDGALDGSSGTGYASDKGSFFTMTTTKWILLVILIVSAFFIYIVYSDNASIQSIKQFFHNVTINQKKPSEKTASAGESKKNKRKDTPNDAHKETQSTADKYDEDSSSSNIQKGSGKRGWCFIGEDRGVRSCAKVGNNDTCMSGDIFPTRDVCVNPKLRA